MLYWEGEEKHGSDNKIINSALDKIEIHLFYRQIHHSPFVYYGQVILLEYVLRQSKPSEFVFRIVSIDDSQSPATGIAEPSIEIKYFDKTEQDTIVKSRVGQGYYRKHLIQLWEGCAVTGCALLPVLKASHAKPWCESSDHERVDPYNGLLLIPNLDSLFDEGFITFDKTGHIISSRNLPEEEAEILHVYQDMKLRKVYPENEKYLDYHRENKFRG